METRPARIYSVVDDDGTTAGIVGYATGKPEDITRYFQDRCGYWPRVEPIMVIDVTPESLEEKMKASTPR